MNLLGIVALDFVKHLRAASKGWQVSPLVTDHGILLCHDHLIYVRPIPTSMSADAFFENNQPEDAARIVLMVKRRKKRLRLIALEFEGPGGVVKLSYWRANGYAQHQESIRRYRRILPRFFPPSPEPEAGYYQLFVSELIRIKRGYKGKKMECVDSFDISVPYEKHVKALLPTVIATIEKSDTWHGKGRQEGREKVAIDLEGKNYTMAHWL